MSLKPATNISTGRESRERKSIVSRRKSVRSRTRSSDARSRSQPLAASNLANAKLDNHPAECVCGPNIFGRVLGPTVDEPLLVGLEAFLKMCDECPPKLEETAPVIETQPVVEEKLEVESEPAEGSFKETVPSEKAPSLSFSSQRAHNGSFDGTNTEEEFDSNRRSLSIPEESETEVTTKIESESQTVELPKESADVQTEETFAQSVEEQDVQSEEPIVEDGIKDFVVDGNENLPENAQEPGETQAAEEPQEAGEPQNAEEAQEEEVPQDADEPQETEDEEVQETNSYFSNKTNISVSPSCSCDVCVESMKTSRKRSSRVSDCSNIDCKCKSGKNRISLDSKRSSRRSSRKGSVRYSGNSNVRSGIGASEISSSIKSTRRGSIRNSMNSNIVNGSSEPSKRTNGSNLSKYSSRIPGGIECSCSTSSTSTPSSVETQSYGMGDCRMQEIRYAITKISKFSDYTTFEVMKSTRKMPRFIPKTLEGVFVLRNRKGSI